MASSGSPSRFKKPLEYDPSLAEKTLGIAAVAVRTTPDVPPLTSEDERKSMLEELGLLDEGDEQSSPEPYIHFDVQPPRSGGISSLRQTPPTGRLPQQSPPSYGGGATPASEGGVTPPRANGAPRAPGDKDLTPTKGQVLQMQNQMSEVKARLSEQELVVVKKEQMLRGLQAQLRASQDQVAQLEAQLQQVQASAALLAASAPARAAAAVPASLQVELEDARRAAAAAAEARDEAVAQAQQLREQMKKQQADFEDRMQSLIASAGKTRENDDARKSAATAAAATAAAAEVREATAARDAATAEVRQLKEELRKQQAEFEGRLAAAEARAGESRVAQGAAAALEGMTPALQKALGQVAALQLSKEALSSEVRALKAETFGGAAVSRLRQQVEQFVGKREAAVKAEAEAAVARHAGEVAALRSEVAEARQHTEYLQSKWRAEFDKRRKLHNMVIELKGSIRVLCRVRPLVDSELAANPLGGDGGDGGGGGGRASLPVAVMDDETVRVTSNMLSKEFEFDRVFGPGAGQADVFDEVSGLITSVLDGYNVCIMAYGQTGSGKTHTMDGPPSDPGVNTRALRELFSEAQARSEAVEYGFRASILEIYNEQIYDLLAPAASDDKLDVKQGPDGLFVAGLTVEPVASLADIAGIVSRGKANRSTFATDMNAHSSRSHLVLSVYVSAVVKATGMGLRGKLHLIDLAGSERVSRSGAEGDRLKEAQNINRSLSALGDVISALQQRQGHVPYRNSKLTRLLEDSLGGASKTVMVVNCSPAAENSGETKCSLEFASRARKVELGRARQNTVMLAPPARGPSPPSGMSSASPSKPPRPMTAK